MLIFTTRLLLDIRAVAKCYETTEVIVTYLAPTPYSRSSIDHDNSRVDCVQTISLVVHAKSSCHSSSAHSNPNPLVYTILVATGSVYITCGFMHNGVSVVHSVFRNIELGRNSVSVELLKMCIMMLFWSVQFGHLLLVERQSLVLSSCTRGVEFCTVQILLKRCTLRVHQLLKITV